MAEVRITIGPVAGIVTIDNAVAEKYARLYAAALGVPPDASDQQRSGQPYPPAGAAAGAG